MKLKNSIYACLAVLALTGASAQQPAQAPSVGIPPFTDATGTGGAQTGVALSHMVQAEFTHSTDMMAFALKPDNNSSGDLDAQKAIAIARSHSLNAVLLGTVLEADSNSSGSNGGTSIFGQMVGGNVGKTSATVTLQGDLFNVATGRKIDSFRVTGKISQIKIGADASTRLGDITNSGSGGSGSALAKALQKSVAALVKKVAADESKILKPPQSHP